MEPRHPHLRGGRRVARWRPHKALAAAVASLLVVAGTLAVYATTGIGLAPAADTVLSCTDTWTGNGGTTDWNTAANWSAGVPDTATVDACISDHATVVVSNASFSVGELTISKGSTLAVGTGGSGSLGTSLSVSLGLENDGTLTAGPSGPGTATLSLDGPITNTGALDVSGTVTVGKAAAASLTNVGTIGVGPGGVLDLGNSSPFTNASGGLLAFGIDGAPTFPAGYGRVINGALALDGSVEPVFENGFTPSPGAEYFVAAGSYSGTFATVHNGATADYSHPNELGLVGGAPATPTTVSVTSTVPTAVFGQGVQFTATVTPASGPDPTGSVSFSAGGVPLGSAPVATAGGVTTATLATSNLPVGPESVAATYSGDVLFGASTSAVLSQTVNPDAVDAAIAASPVNPVPGQQVTYRVTMSAAPPGAGSPAGAVSLTDNAIPVAGCQALTLPSSIVPEVSCSETYGSDATHSVVATYGGNTDFLTATTQATETVAPLSTTTSVTASSSVLTYGQAVSFTATVVPIAGTESPTGSVTFTDNGITLGTSTLTTDAGVATTSMLVTTLPRGPNAIMASYGGDPGSAPSASTAAAPLTVTTAPTELSLGSSVNPSTYGQSVTITASVFPATGSGETGTVTFFSNGSAIGTGSVENGQATLTTATLPVGTDAVTAHYGGDDNFAGSVTTDAWTQEVDPPPG